MTVHRPPAVRPHHRKPMFTLTLLASLGAQEKTNMHRLHINVVINWQLSKQGIRWQVSPDRTAGSSVDPSRSSIFLKLSADKLPISNDRRLKFIFSKDSYQICHYGPAKLGFWFQTDLGSENSSSFFKSTGGEDLILPWSRIGHALRPVFILWLVKIWQVSLCGKIMQHLESSLLWQLKLTEFCVNLWCF